LPDPEVPPSSGPPDAAPSPVEAIPGEITNLLAAMRQGDDQARDDLWSVVYDELRILAHRRLRGRHSGQTLDTTALVHEAFVKLMDGNDCPWQDRAHFLGVAAVAMRNILVDYARRGQAKKRGGDDRRVTFDELQVRVSNKATEMLAIDQALTALAEVDPRLCRLVELRFFAGLTVEETAEVLDISQRTVKRDWRKAKAFLYRTLEGDGGEES
jgi:RNA polymerase sigma factor (TIGR02999 family)